MLWKAFGPAWGVSGRREGRLVGWLGGREKIPAGVFLKFFHSLSLLVVVFITQKAEGLVEKIEKFLKKSRAGCLSRGLGT